jgi:hypothetical protein
VYVGPLNSRESLQDRQFLTGCGTQVRRAHACLRVLCRFCARGYGCGVDTVRVAPGCCVWRAPCVFRLPFLLASTGLSSISARSTPGLAPHSRRRRPFTPSSLRRCTVGRVSCCCCRLPSVLRCLDAVRSVLGSLPRVGRPRIAVAVLLLVCLSSVRAVCELCLVLALCVLECGFWRARVLS